MFRALILSIVLILPTVGFSKSPILLIWNDIVSYDPLEGNAYLMAKLIKDTREFEDSACSAKTLKETEVALKRSLSQKYSKHILSFLENKNPLEAIKVHVCRKEGSVSIEGFTSIYGSKIPSFIEYDMGRIQGFISSSLREIRRLVITDLRRSKNPITEDYKLSNDSKFFQLSDETKTNLFGSYETIESFQSCEIVESEQRKKFLVSPKEVIQINESDSGSFMSIKFTSNLILRNIYSQGTRRTNSFNFHDWSQFFKILESSSYCAQIEYVKNKELVSIAKSTVHSCNNSQINYIKIVDNKFTLIPSDYSCNGAEKFQTLFEEGETTPPQ